MRIWRITVLRRETASSPRSPGTWGRREYGSWGGRERSPGTGAYHMLKNAEAAALRHGGDKLVIDGGREEEAVRKSLSTRPGDIVTETDTSYIIDLIVPDEDGDVHEDFDDRTPLHRITCPTCVERIAHKRTEKRRTPSATTWGPGK